MMDMPVVRKVDPAAVVAEAHSALATTDDPGEIKKIEASLDAIEDHMRATDVYSPDEVRLVSNERTQALARLQERASLTKFDPDVVQRVVLTLQHAVELAAQMHEWDAAMDAAKLMVQWQHDFVAWWDANVGVRKSAGGSGTRTVPYNADLRSMTSLAKAESKTKITQQQVSRWRKATVRPGYADRIFDLAYKKAMADKAQRRSDLQTGEMEWFTPSVYIEKARRVLGVIDLDPASCALAQETVQASHFLTVEDDGLMRMWLGNVWLNPPRLRPKATHASHLPPRRYAKPRATPVMEESRPVLPFSLSRS
jgi:hypothetical protein